MFFVDTHTHLYLEEFDADRAEIVRAAIDAGVTAMILPNIDSSSIQPIQTLCHQFSENCFPTAGLHPTSVKEDFKDEMAIVEHQLQTQKYCAIGESGIDLYWDKTFFKTQDYCFNRQLELAVQYQLPIIIHSRNALDEIFAILKNFGNTLPPGIFHCFPGNTAEAEKAIELGFYLGIGGVVTFKNNKLIPVVEAIPLQYFVLETDAPYLAPVPFRGQRNQSAYIPIIAQQIAILKNTTLENVAEITTKTACNLFKIK